MVKMDRPRRGRIMCPESSTQVPGWAYEVRIIQSTIYIMLVIAFLMAAPSGILRKRSPRAAQALAACAMFLNPAVCAICWACVSSIRTPQPDQSLKAALTLALMSSPVLVVSCTISALAGILVGSIFSLRKLDQILLRCDSCGYLLRGLTLPRCPECALPFDPAILERDTGEEVRRDQA